MPRAFIVIAILISLAQSACKKEIELDLKDSESQYVLNSILSTDSLVQVQITKGASITESDPIYPPILNASVTLTDQNGQTIALSHIGNGFYQSSVAVVANNNYTVKAQISNNPELTAQTTSPVKVDITAIDTSRELITYQVGYTDSVRTIDITFEDPSITKDFYSVNLELVYYDQFMNEFGQLDSILITKKPSFNSNLEGFNWNNIFYFNDEKQFSSAFTFNISLFENDFNDYDEFTGNAFKIRNPKINVVLNHISQELYLYAKSVNDQSYTEFDPFATPVIVYENIENGVGIFGSRTASGYEFIWQ